MVKIFYFLIVRCTFRVDGRRYHVPPLHDIYEAYRNENSQYTEDGKFYSLPFNKSTEITFYNKTVFNKYDWFVGLLGYGLIGAHVGYTMGATITGWSAFKQYLGNVFIISYLVCCFVYILGYIIYYLAREKDNKLSIKKDIGFRQCLFKFSHQDSFPLLS